MSNARKAIQTRRRTKEDVRARANQKSGNFDSIFSDKVKVYKPKDGKNLIRILPPTWPDAPHFGYDIFVNYGIGADNQSYLSLSEMKGEKDPIKEAKQEAEKEGDRELSKALTARKRVAIYLIDRLDEDEGPQIWSAPFTWDRDFANLCIDEDTGEIIEPDDPEEGCDVRFYKEGKGLTTEYNPSKMKLLKPSHLHEDEELQNDWLDQIEQNPIPDVLQFYDYDHISTVFDGVARVEKDEDNDKTSRRRSRDVDENDEKPSNRGRSRDVDNEDRKPASRRSSRRDPDGEDEEKETKRTSSKRADPDEEPRSKRSSQREPDPEEEPPARRRASREDPPFKEDEKPARGRVRGKPVDEAEEEPDPDAGEGEEVAEEKPARSKLRERLRAARDKDK